MTLAMFDFVMQVEGEMAFISRLCAVLLFL